VFGPDGLSRFDKLSRQTPPRTAILDAFDLIERDGEDLRHLPFLDRKAALAWLLRDTETGILLNEPPSRMLVGLGHIVSKKVDSTYRSGPCST
jgi:ATP-dependent DNA ligase